jgi:hypothetical protein
MGPIDCCSPTNYGWLRAKLSKKEMDFLWDCIAEEKIDAKRELAGNIDSSFFINDKDHWFSINVLSRLIEAYLGQFTVPFSVVSKKRKMGFELSTFWVNYQKKHEFNPFHAHSGVWSFVVWMKIPTNHKEQNAHSRSSNSNTPCASAFQFVYSNILGTLDSSIIEMSPDVEGTIIFFPANLHHQVYPFYDCDEERISVSGNISIVTE